MILIKICIFFFFLANYHVIMKPFHPHASISSQKYKMSLFMHQVLSSYSTLLAYYRQKYLVLLPSFTLAIHIFQYMLSSPCSSINIISKTSFSRMSNLHLSMQKFSHLLNNLIGPICNPRFTHFLFICTRFSCICFTRFCSNSFLVSSIFDIINSQEYLNLHVLQMILHYTNYPLFCLVQLLI